MKEVALVFAMQLHSSDLGNEQAGSLACRIGYNRGIGCASQVEACLRAYLTAAWHRAYVIEDALQVVAIWCRPVLKHSDALYVRNLLHVARAAEYRGEWLAEFVDAAATQVVTGHFGLDATTFDAAHAWAIQQLTTDNVAAAVTLCNGGVYGAWERSPHGPQLVARTPY